MNPMRTTFALLALLLTTPLLPSAFAAEAASSEADACTTALGTVSRFQYLPYSGSVSTGGTNPNTGCHWTGLGTVAPASCSTPTQYCRYDGVFVRA